MESVTGGVRKSLFARPPASPSRPLPPVGDRHGGPGALPPIGAREGSTGALAPETVWRATFHGSGGPLLGIHVVNVFLILITLGVYYCWAKTRVRRYLSSETEFAGDRFAYHGTGKELLLGFFKAFLVFLLPLILLRLIQDRPDLGTVTQAAAVLGSGLFLIFVPLAIVGARRYRLSRTSWRGIRFSFRGHAWWFILLFNRPYLYAAIVITFVISFTDPGRLRLVLMFLLVGLPLLLYYPFFLTQRQAFMVSHSYFGNERFQFNGRGRDLLGNYLLAVLLTLPTLGLCWFWFLARKRRFFWNHTRFGVARFRSKVSGGAVLGLYLVNGLLLLATLGVAWPWVRVRNIRFAFRYLTLEGAIDLERIEQQAQVASATGEGLAGFLDTGFDLG